MTTRTSRTTLLMGAVAVASFSFTACGGSGGGGGNSAADVETFCTRYEEFDNDTSLDDDDALLDALKEIQGLSPDEIADDFGAAIEAFEALSVFTEQLEAGEDVDENDPDLVAASEKLDTAGENVEEYVAANCGLES